MGPISMRKQRIKGPKSEANVEQRGHDALTTSAIWMSNILAIIGLFLANSNPASFTAGNSWSFGQLVVEAQIQTLGFFTFRVSGAKGCTLRNVFRFLDSRNPGRTSFEQIFLTRQSYSPVNRKSENPQKFDPCADSFLIPQKLANNLTRLTPGVRSLKF